MAKRPQRPAPTKELSPNIGITDANRKAVIALLNHRLSDTVTLYIKTRNYHWNVTGMHFAELHEFFEEQYDQLDESMDAIAERVRQLGGVALGTLKEFAAQTALEEHPGVVPTAEEMVRALLDDHEAVIRQLRADVDATAQQFSDSGTSDFLTSLMEAHEKMAWMLRAHLA